MIRGSRLCRKFGAIALALCISVVGVSPAHAATFEESQIKAAFLFHFFHFIKWPGPQAQETINPLVFCALHEGPVEIALKELLLASQAHHSTTLFGLIADPSDTSACDYLFISSADKHLIPEAIKSTDGKAILTVSDSEGFAHQGGMIELVRRENRIHVLINLHNVTAHGLRVSSKLLQLATIISANERGSEE